MGKLYNNLFIDFIVFKKKILIKFQSGDCEGCKTYSIAATYAAAEQATVRIQLEDVRTTEKLENPKRGTV